VSLFLHPPCQHLPISAEDIVLTLMVMREPVSHSVCFAMSRFIFHPFVHVVDFSVFMGKDSFPAFLVAVVIGAYPDVFLRDSTHPFREFVLRHPTMDSDVWSHELLGFDLERHLRNPKSILMTAVSARARTRTIMMNAPRTLTIASSPVNAGVPPVGESR